MDFHWPRELADLADEAAAFARDVTASLDITEDSWLRGADAAIAAELGRRGWLGMALPVEVGGGGRTPLERFAVFETLIAHGVPLATAWFGDRQIGPTLLQFGTPEQREQFLPGLLGGTAAWCVGMSEPDAGSDVASLRTRADRHGNRWIVNGQKIWTSGAAHADWCYLIARSDPEAAPHEGLSEFIVDLRSPGVEIRPIRDMTDDEHFCEIHFSDVEVPDNLLVGQENGAFRQIMRQMEHERGGIDRLVSNRRLAVDVAELVDHSDPLVRQELAAIESGYRIGRHMVLREVMGQAPKGWSAITKTWCTEYEVRVSDFCGRAMGPCATAWEAGDGDRLRAVGRRVARNLCYAPGYTIMGGTVQILRNIVGERMLGLPRAPR